MDSKNQRAKVVASVVEKIIPIIHHTKVSSSTWSASTLAAETESEANINNATNLSMICRLYDDLILADDDDAATAKAVSISSTSRGLEVEIMRLRLTKEKEIIQEISVAMIDEADYYRSVVLVSLFLLEILMLPSVTMMMGSSAAASNEVRKTLERASLLLRIYETIYMQFVVPRKIDNNNNNRNLNIDDGDSQKLPTKYPELENGIDQLKEEDLVVGLLGEKNSNILSIDREQLESDEIELLRMANAPTPAEQQQNHNYATNDDKQPHPVGFIKASDMDDSNTIRVELDEAGIITTPKAKNCNQYWAITSKSSIEFQNNSIICISHVTTNLPKLKTTNLTLDVGRDGYIWWEGVSKFVSVLTEVKNVQDETVAHWSQEEYNQTRSSVRREILREPTAIRNKE